VYVKRNVERFHITIVAVEVLNIPYVRVLVVGRAETFAFCRNVTAYKTASLITNLFNFLNPKM
jgi:hypothetical protein